MSLTKIQQSQMSGSLAFDDALDVRGSEYLTKPDRTLVDDLNALRTQIKVIQGTDAWTSALAGSQSLSEIEAAMKVDGTTVNFEGDVYVADDSFVSGSLEVAGAVEFLDNLKVGGDLQVMGNDLSGSAGGNMRFEDAGKVVVAGDLKVDGNHIVASDNTTAITLSGADVEIAGVLKVSGDEIQDSSGHAMVTFDAAGGSAEVDGDLSVTGEMFVDGGKITLSSGATIDSLTQDELYIDETLVKLSGDLQVMGDNISGSAGLNLTLGANGDVTVDGELQVDGDAIRSSAGTTVITLSGINASVAGNLTVTGDLVISGDTTVVDTEHLLVKDAVVGLGFASGSVKEANGDRGFVFSRADENVAAFWDEDTDEFKLAFTDNSPGDDNIVVDTEVGYVNFRANNVVAEGNLTVNGNDIYGSEGLNISFEADGRVLVAGEFEVMGDHISGSNGLNISLLSGGDVEIKGDLVVVGNQISGSGGVGHLTLQADGDVRVAGELEVAGGFVTLSNGSTIDSTVAGTLTITEEVVALSGDLKVGGDDIKASDDSVAISLSGADVKVAGVLTVGGNDIQSWDGLNATTAMTLSGDDVEVKGELQVTGNTIKSSAGSTVFALSGADATVEGNLVVEGDFVVNGAMTIVNTDNLVVKDPIVGLGYVSGANGPTEAGAGDRGFVFSIPESNNVATFWDNVDSEFKMVYTVSGPDATDISEDGFANFRAGIIYSEMGFSGSLTKLVDGDDYLIAGVGITLSTGTNGAITISGASNSYAKGYFDNGDLTGASSNVLSFSGLGILSSGADVDKNVDVYLNGALLAFGEGRDVVAISTTSVTLNATLAASLTSDDVLTVALRSLA